MLILWRVEEQKLAQNAKALGNVLHATALVVVAIAEEKVTAAVEKQKLIAAIAIMENV
jgi:hypothetical protein